MSSELQDSIGYRLIQICRAHRNRAEAALNALGLYTGQELLLFQLWEEEGLTQSQLGEILCVEPPTVTRMLQRMEKGGLIERRQDVEDARVSRVYLTPKGRSLQKPVREVWANLETVTVQGLSDVEKALLSRLLNQIDDNLTR